MIDTLQKMSGITHKAFRESKNVTVDKSRLAMQTENNVTYTITVKEVPVITYNNMAFISERNSIVFRAGDSPIWNRNQTILPMSWRLFQNTIIHPGHDYSLQTIPTLSSALDFDIRKNQPDFDKMLEKRMIQARYAERAKAVYKAAYEYEDNDIIQMDPDNYAGDVMEVINGYINQNRDTEEDIEDGMMDDPNAEDMDFVAQIMREAIEENTEQLQETDRRMAEKERKARKLYAGGYLSKEDLMGMNNGINHEFDVDISAVYNEYKGDMWQDTVHFKKQGNDLYGATNGKLYIHKVNESDSLSTINASAKDPDSRVYADEAISKEDLKRIGSYIVYDDFYRFLVSMESWSSIAKGRFEEGMKRRMSER